MTKRFKCIKCNTTTTLEETDNQYDYYGICSLCGTSYLITFREKVKINDN